MDLFTDLLTNYLTDPRNLIIASCFVIGRVCKGIPKVPDWSIPIIVGVAGIIQGVMFIGGPKGGVMGFIFAAVAVYGHQLFRQLLEKDPGAPAVPKADSNTDIPQGSKP